MLFLSLPVSRILLLFLFLPSLASAEHLHKEKEYQNVWCTKARGVTEVVLDDKARVDCVTDEYAIEFDFAPKWAESVGQALYYAEMTGKRPGVVLILEIVGDERYLKRLQRIAERYRIMVWTTSVDDLH